MCIRFCEIMMEVYDYVRFVMYVIDNVKWWSKRSIFRKKYIFVLGLFRLFIV